MPQITSLKRARSFPEQGECTGEHRVSLVTQVEPGRFRITGLMLHMTGRWRLTFDVVQADRRTRLSQDVDLEP